MVFLSKKLAELPVAWPDLVLAQRRQAKNVLREVYLDGERYVFKRFVLNRHAVAYSRSWVTEARALGRLLDLPVPRHVANYAGKNDRGLREFVLQRTLIQGKAIHQVTVQRVEAMAELLAALHLRGVVTRDATIDNFLDTANCFSINSPDKIGCGIDPLF